MKTKILSPLRRDGYKAGMIMMLIALSTMLLTTACSSEDDLVNNTANTENTINKGYALPVTVNVTRGDGATRATYNESTKKLEFSAGDKLFVEGLENGVAGQFAGELTWQSDETFSGTIYTQKEWTGTADALFSAATSILATLLPNGYQSTGFLSINNNNSPAIAYDDEASPYFNGAFVASETAKATGVEQLSFEQASTYSDGFALAPVCAILNFTISGLEAGEKTVTLNVVKDTHEYTVTGSVTPTSGVATFAIGVPVGANIKNMDNNLTVGSSNLTLPSSTTFAAGHIYNITRNAIPGALSGQFTVGMDGSTPIKVYFSKGNLQATTTNKGTSWAWAFAANQWSYVGNAAPNGAIIGNKTVDTNGTVDLFGWSTAYAENYLGIHNSVDDVCYSGDFVDWGSHADVIAGIGSGWCTLSKAEWLYLFYGRMVNGDKGIGYSFTVGQNVNNVFGVVLYPDDYKGDAYTTGSNWSTFESAGCVFLPAAGYRDWEGVNDAGDRAYYWSSSPDSSETDYAHDVYFDSDDLNVDGSDSRYFGHSVRLVRPVQ